MADLDSVSAAIGELRGLLVGVNASVERIAEQNDRHFDEDDRRFAASDKRLTDLERGAAARAGHSQAHGRLWEMMIALLAGLGGGFLAGLPEFLKLKN